MTTLALAGATPEKRPFRDFIEPGLKQETDEQTPYDRRRSVGT